MADDPIPAGRETDERDARAFTRRQARETWVARRRRRIAEEIDRNRRGEHKVPTWVLAAILVALVVGWFLLIALS